MTFIEYKVDQGGVHPTLDKSKAVHNACAPKTIRKLQDFFGTARIVWPFSTQSFKCFETPSPTTTRRSHCWCETMRRLQLQEGGHQLQDGVIVAHCLVQRRLRKWLQWSQCPSKNTEITIEPKQKHQVEQTVGRRRKHARYMACVSTETPTTLKVILPRAGPSKQQDEILEDSRLLLLRT